MQVFVIGRRLDPHHPVIHEVIGLPYKDGEEVPSTVLYNLLEDAKREVIGRFPEFINAEWFYSLRTVRPLDRDSPTLDSLEDSTHSDGVEDPTCVASREGIPLEVAHKVIKVLKESGLVQEDTSLQTPIEDLGLDSLDEVDILIGLETQFNIYLDKDQFEMNLDSMKGKPIRVLELCKLVLGVLGTRRSM